MISLFVWFIVLCFKIMFLPFKLIGLLLGGLWIDNCRSEGSFDDGFMTAIILGELWK